MKIRTKAVWGSCVLLALLGRPAAAFAQSPETPPPAATPPPPAAQPQTSDPDSRLDPLQPDFSLAALPTSLRLPVHKLAFRVTHRFSRALGDGDFSDLVSNSFGFDSGARIGLELRYGLLPGTQIGVNRTSERSIEIFGQQSVMKETKDGHPLSLDIHATLEGKDNLQGQKMSAIGVIVSRKIGKFAAVYAEPLFVANTNSLDSGTGVENNTTMIGLGDAPARASGDVPGRRDHAALERLQAGRQPGQLRPRGTGRRPHVSDQLLERLRDHSRPDRDRRHQLRLLVYRLQHFKKVFLTP